MQNAEKYQLLVVENKNVNYVGLLSSITRLFYSLYSKCPPFALMKARRRLRKLTLIF